MRVYSLFVLLAVCAPGLAKAGSFDCSKASGPADLVICSNPALLDRNEALETAWSTVRKEVDPSWQQALLTDQREWVASLAKECDLSGQGKPDDKILAAAEYCIGDQIDKRKDVLLTLPRFKDQLLHAATPERSRTALTAVICDDDRPRLLEDDSAESDPPASLQACLERAGSERSAALAQRQDDTIDPSFERSNFPELVTNADEAICRPFMEAVRRDYSASHDWDELSSVTGELSGTIFGTGSPLDDGTMISIYRDQVYSVKLRGEKGRRLLFVVRNGNHNVHEKNGLFLSKEGVSRGQIGNLVEGFYSDSDKEHGEELFNQDFFEWAQNGPLFRVFWIKGDLYAFRDRDYESGRWDEAAEHVFGKGKFGLFKIGADINQSPVCVAAIDERAAWAIPQQAGAQAAPLPKFRELIAMLHTLDGEGAIECGGSSTPYVWGRHRATVDFALRMALARPWELMKATGADGDSIAGNSRIDAAFLKRWGFQSLYNFRVVEHLNRLLPETANELSAYYVTQFKLSSELASAVADAVLQQVLDAEIDIHSNVTNPPSDEEFSQDYEQRIGDLSVTAEMMPRAVLQGRRDLVERTPDQLVAGIAKTMAESDGAGVEPLLFYALDDMLMTKILISKGVGVDDVNWFGKSALMYAAQWDKLDVLSVLLQYKASPNLYTEPVENSLCRMGPQVTHRSALMYAAENASSGVIDALLKAGADIRAQTQPNSQGVDTFLSRNRQLSDAEKAELSRRLAQ
jgi:uncharacterized protein YecT (DUF1311 family)